MFRRHNPGNSTSPDAGISARQHIDGGIANHPCVFQLRLSVLQDLKDPIGPGFFFSKLLPP
jgi:hypothetical protein